MIRILITILLFLLVGCSRNIEKDTGFLSLDEIKINSEKELIEILQETEKNEINNYKRISKYEKDKLEYEIHEYKTSEGEIGYQIFIFGDYFIQSIGYGIESSSRTWIETFSTTTSTTTTSKEISTTTTLIRDEK